jgi:hypothetical protein
MILHSYHKKANIAMASSNMDWICCQCTHKNEGSSEPGPCHFCQTPHPKRKAVVVSVPTSASTAKSVCIRQPARRSSGSVSALPAKPVCIGQTARYSGSFIDLSDPDAAQDGASAASLAKAVSIRQPSPRSSSGSVIDLSTSPAKPVFGQSSSVVKENRVLADQNHALAIVVGQMKSREIEAANRFRALEVTRDRLSLDYDRLYSEYQSQLDVIGDLQVRLVNNNDDGSN